MQTRRSWVRALERQRDFRSRAAAAVPRREAHGSARAVEQHETRACVSDAEAGGRFHVEPEPVQHRVLDERLHAERGDARAPQRRGDVDVDVEPVPIRRRSIARYCSTNPISSSSGTSCRASPRSVARSSVLSAKSVSAARAPSPSRTSATVALSALSALSRKCGRSCARRVASSASADSIDDRMGRLVDALRDVEPPGLNWHYASHRDLTHATIFRGELPAALIRALG